MQGRPTVPIGCTIGIAFRMQIHEIPLLLAGGASGYSQSFSAPLRNLLSHLNQLVRLDRFLY